MDFSFCFIFPHEFSCIAIPNSKMKLSHKVHKLKSSAADDINIISIDSSLISQEIAVVKERKKIQSLTDVASSLEFYLHGMSKLENHAS